MNYLPSFELVSFYTGMMSLCLGAISFIASLFFYDKARKSENENNKILYDISSTTTILNSLTNRMLEKTIGHIANSNEQLIKTLVGLNNTTGKTDFNDDTSRSLLLFSYILKTNFLAKALYLQSSCEKTKSSLSKVIDLSYEDYKALKTKLADISETELKESPVYEKYIADKSLYEEVAHIKLSGMAQQLN